MTGGDLPYVPCVTGLAGNTRAAGLLCRTQKYTPEYSLHSKIPENPSARFVCCPTHRPHSRKKDERGQEYLFSHTACSALPTWVSPEEKSSNESLKIQGTSLGLMVALTLPRGVCPPCSALYAQMPLALVLRIYPSWALITPTKTPPWVSRE